MDLIHANSVKAGYLDLEGATVVDLLPRYTSILLVHKADKIDNV